MEPLGVMFSKSSSQHEKIITLYAWKIAYILSQLCKKNKYKENVWKETHQLTVIVFEWSGYESFIFFFILF